MAPNKSRKLTTLSREVALRAGLVDVLKAYMALVPSVLGAFP